VIDTPASAQGCSIDHVLGYEGCQSPLHRSSRPWLKDAGPHNTAPDQQRTPGWMATGGPLVGLIFVYTFVFLIPLNHRYGHRVMATITRCAHVGVGRAFSPLVGANFEARSYMVGKPLSHEAPPDPLSNPLPHLNVNRHVSRFWERSNLAGEWPVQSRIANRLARRDALTACTYDAAYIRTLSPRPWGVAGFFLSAPS
jgi:hypothetical protein